MLPPFDVQHYLRERKALVDSTLTRYLERKRRWPRRLLQAMRYGVFSGGKRIRPILTLASGDVFGAQKKSLLPFACALEFIHAYSLIHDDLPALDDDDFRGANYRTIKFLGRGPRFWRATRSSPRPFA